MKKYLIALALVVLAGVIAAVLYLKPAEPRYNLLLITLDTTRADHLGCYGYSKAETPNLDSLARSGVKFSRAFCNVPLTLPSHATMMTGLYPPEHGCRVNGAHTLAEGVGTLAEVFASHGYQTAAFVAAFVLDSKFGLNRGFKTYDQFEVPTAEEIYDDSKMYRYRSADKVADAALAWLRTHSRRPFFCWVHFFDPHRPYNLRQPFMRRYMDSPYDGEIAFMDSQIGRILGFLKERRLLEKTIVLAVGDHGESLGEHGEDEHGLLLYNSGMHVPLLVSCPGRLPRGTEVAGLVSTVDLFPTILDIFGWKAPGRVSGESFAPALASRAVEPAPFYAETEFPLTEYGWSPLQSVTTEEWRYIKAPREELYDLKSDPKELANLAPKKPDKVKEMQARLAALEKEMVKTESSEVAMDEASRKVLESLGYLGGGGSKKKEDTASLRDPKDAVWMRKEFIQAVDELHRGDSAGAEAILRKLIKASPESYAFRYRLAKMFYDQGRFDKAIPEFEEMAKMAPDEFRGHYNLAKTLIKTGQYDRAVGELRAALSLDEEQTDGWNNLGLALLKSGKAPEAMDAFKKSISLKSDQVDPHNNLGNALLSLGRTDEALAEFRKAIAEKPDFFEGRYNVGLILMTKGKYEEAAREFTEAVKISPGFPDAHKNLGLALMRSGRQNEGLQEFARAEQLRRQAAQRR